MLNGSDEFDEEKVNKFSKWLKLNQIIWIN